MNFPERRPGWPHQITAMQARRFQCHDPLRDVIDQNVTKLIRVNEKSFTSEGVDETAAVEIYVADSFINSDGLICEIAPLDTSRHLLVPELARITLEAYLDEDEIGTPEMRFFGPYDPRKKQCEDIARYLSADQLDIVERTEALYNEQRLMASE